MVSCALDACIKVWLLSTGDCIRTFIAPDHAPRCIKVINEGQHKSAFVTGGGDCRLKVWRMSTTACVATMTGHSAPVTALAHIPLQPLELLSSGEDGSVRLWNLDRMCELRCIAQSHTGPISGLVCWLETTTARLLEMEMESRNGGTEHPSHDATHHSSGMKLTSDKGGGLQSYLLQERARGGHGHVGGHVRDERDVEVRYATCGNDGTVKVWRHSKGACSMVLQGHKAAVTCVTEAVEHVSASSSSKIYTGQAVPVLVSGSRDRTMLMWRRHDGHCLGAFSERMLSNNDERHLLSATERLRISDHARGASAQHDHEYSTRTAHK